MDRPLTCVGALVRGPDGRWLIVRTTKWRGAWGVPGGKVEYGETLADALRREFREEVGLHVTDERFAQVQEAVLSPEFHKPAHFVLVDFLAETRETDVVPNEEIETWAWVTLDEAMTYPLNSFTRTLVEVARERG
ncbi:NUDIX domain-containing protein [Deinococcus pimensis]|uniref:NUDIX domain-containing protein n=1 Tax=Deinococcus pimensis TaxID=309888 RepID=UPI00047F46C7|nr:NUDIX domain-containing protein [Deinococcus pimensis]